MLDSFLQKRGGEWWDDFFSDRERPCPFFVENPDENLVSYFNTGQMKAGRVLELGCGHGRNADKKVYFWDIIDVKSRYLLASHASFSRGASEAKKLMKLAEQRAGKTPKIVRTDKLRSYVSGIEEGFGADTKNVQGGPFKFVDSGESTAKIERFHKTLEQRTKVFEKFKDIESIKLLTDGWLINYNFFKQNEGCGKIGMM